MSSAFAASAAHPHRANTSAGSSSSAAKASATANNGAEGAAHAYVENGEIFIVQGGRYFPFSRAAAFVMAQDLSGSPCVGSRERGRQIQAALDATYDSYFFSAPRHGDLVACPYCDANTFSCDHCGGERRLYANEVFQ